MAEKIERVLLDGEQGLRSVDCVLRRSARARRMNLRVTSREMAILTLPNRSSWSEGVSFLASQREWLRKKTLGFPSVTRLDEYFQKGGKVWLDENPRTLVWSQSEVCLRNSTSIGQEVIVLGLSPKRDLEAELMKSCTTLAKKSLPVRLAKLSADHGLDWKKYRVGNQKSRWGSCSNNGTISLNWRLILLPYELGSYILCHELAHLKHMNHSAAFWDFLESLVPGAQKLDLKLRNLSRTVMGLARNT
jgi:predicted metal-dependent hydrolase